MTYDYYSNLFNSKGIHATIDDLPGQLLRGLQAVREKSMAAIELHDDDRNPLRGDQRPLKYETIALERCGFVFLGTPHRGSEDANVGSLLLSLAGTMTGLNTELAKALSSKSVSAKEANKRWATFYFGFNPSNRPPIACFAEASPTKLKAMASVMKGTRSTMVRANNTDEIEDAEKLNVEIVPQECAVWMDQVQPAVLPYTDHHSICRFSTQQNDAFVEIEYQMNKMTEDLLRRVQDTELLRNLDSDDPGTKKLADKGRSQTHPSWRSPIVHMTIATEFSSMRKRLIDVQVMKLIDTQGIVPKSARQVSIQMTENDSESLPGGFVAKRQVSSHLTDIAQRSSVSSKAPSSTDMEDNRSLQSLDDAMSGKYAFESPETDAMKHTILSLDDGGVRGYVALLVLRRLMDDIDYWERRNEDEGPVSRDEMYRDALIRPNQSSSPLSQTVSDSTSTSQGLEHIKQVSQSLIKPCEYFDFIVGSGTGG
ncbi:MAG: hypothetical protein Q9162_006411 [Coniocarpon cinnabarinum]